MIYATLAVCAVLAGLLIYRYDLYDREPWYMALIAVGLGAAAMLALSEIETWTLIHVLAATPRNIAFVAATHEELARLLIVLGIAMTAQRHFNDPIDGLVYGSLVGLGMAITESVFLIQESAGTLRTLPPSEPVRILAHLVLGGITGYAIGPLRIKHSDWRPRLVGCVGFTLAWHFTWDWIAFTALARGFMTWPETIAGMVLMLAGLVFYGALVARGSRDSREALAPDSERNVWGWPFTGLRK
jgi:RsiW-degrading membrane proteinase PrsW (M82 family)